MRRESEQHDSFVTLVSLWKQMVLHAKNINSHSGLGGIRTYGFRNQCKRRDSSYPNSKRKRTMKCKEMNMITVGNENQYDETSKSYSFHSKIDGVGSVLSSARCSTTSKGRESRWDASLFLSLARDLRGQKMQNWLSLGPFRLWGYSKQPTLGHWSQISARCRVHAASLKCRDRLSLGSLPESIDEDSNVLPIMKDNRRRRIRGGR